MSADGKIYITISDARTGEVIKGTDISVSDKPKKKTEEEKRNDFIQHQLFHLIEKEAKQMVQYSLGNIGNFTGDYNAQRDVNYALSATGVLSSIAMGALAGAKYGPWGAAIGAGVVAASQAVNFGLQLHSQNVEIKKQNYNISQLRQLSGLDGLTNGSRI